MPPVARTPGITGLPGLGSPLMAQLVKFLQARNPAVLVNESNVGDFALNKPGLVGRNMPGKPFVTRQSSALFDALAAAGLIRPPAGSAVGTTWALRQRGHHPGFETYSGYVGGPPDPYANMNMWSPSGGGVSAPQVPVNTLPAQVPVNTLPGSSPGGVQPPPLAQTPVGPMFYPPGPSPLGARDPRRNYLFG